MLQSRAGTSWKDYNFFYTTENVYTKKQAVSKKVQEVW